MVRVINTGAIAGGRQYLDYAGLSTDDKPTGNIMTGSTFLEVDTGDVYLYDEVGDSWMKVGGDNA